MIDITKNYEKIKRFSFLNKVLIYLFYIFLYSLRSICKIKSNYSDQVLIISYNKLGDTVFTFPALKYLEMGLKKKITILCSPDQKLIYQLSFKNFNFIEATASDFYKIKRIAKGKLRKKVKNIDPEIVIDFTGGLCSASLIFLSKSYLIIGMNSVLLKGMYDKFIIPTFSNHLTEIYLNISKLIIKEPNSNQDIIKDVQIKKLSKILIHPFAGWKSKEWNFIKFVHLAKKISRYYNVSLIFPSNSLEKDVLTELTELKISFIQTNNLNDLINEIKNCSLLICNDSGPIQIAGILGIPTFTVFGPTNPVFHLPLNIKHSYIRKLLKCSPQNKDKMCFTNGGRYGCPSYECMSLLKINDVQEKLYAFIDELNTNFKNTANKDIIASK